MIDGQPHQHRAPRARGGVITAAPWLRAPLLLLRLPGVFLAIVGAAAVLAIASASGVLFLGTLGTASLRAQAAADCPEASLPSATAGVPGSQLAQIRAAGSAEFAASGLGTTDTAEVSSVVIDGAPVHLFARPGALDHVQRLTPPGGTGAWVPDTFAAQLGLRPGSTVLTGGGAPLRIAGIYRDLAPSPFRLAHLSPYWCTWSAQIVPTAASDAAIAATPINFRQAPWLITDEGVLAGVSDGQVSVSWYAAVPAATALSGYDAARAKAISAAARISAQFATVVAPGTALGDKSAIAHAARNGVSGSIVPIDIAGVVVALLLVAGVGVFWAAHRSREIRLLVARGIGPAQLGLKAALEATPPALLGTAAGYAGALLLVRAVGPTTVLEPGTQVDGLLIALGVLLAGLVLIGLIGGLSARDRAFAAPRGWVRLVPWELALLAVAVWMGILIRAGAGVTVTHTIVRVSPLAFVFPIIGSTAVLLLVGRAVAWLLPKAANAAHRGLAGYFALRRLAGSRGVVVALVVGTALPCCLLTYGSTITRGVSDEVTTKYRTNLGAEHVLSVYGLHNTVPNAQGHATFVATFQSEPVLADRTPAYVLGVDPATFADFAFLSASQRHDVARLHQVGAGARVPAILVNAPGTVDASSVAIGSTTIPLAVVARTALFPGLRNGSRLMIVVDTVALTHVDPNADRQNQMWTSSRQRDDALAMLDRDGYSVLTEITSGVVVGTTGLLPITWVFGYLRALAILIGVVAVAGLIFALAARTRRRAVSYVLSRRMGMSQLTHVRSLLIELAFMVGVGWLAGSGVGAGAFGVIYRSLDVYPSLPPPMQFVLPAFTLVATAVVTALVIVVASVATHAVAERARPAAILRLE